MKSSDCEKIFKMFLTSTPSRCPLCRHTKCNADTPYKCTLFVLQLSPITFTEFINSLEHLDDCVVINYIAERLKIMPTDVMTVLKTASWTLGEPDAD